MFIEQYADAHTHLKDYDDYHKIIKESVEQGVQYIGIINFSKQVCNSTTHEYFDLSQYQNIINSIGIHPWYIPEHPINYQYLEQLLDNNKSLQIGEIGLDFIKAKEKLQQKIQIEIFIKHMELAIKYNRAVSVHCVRASGEMLKIMKKILKNTTFKNSIIMHSYNCSKEITQSFDKLYPNFYYSFSTNLKLENLEYINPNKLLFESDGPHQYNEKIVYSELKQSHPTFIKTMIQIASLHLNKPNLAQIVFENFKRAFIYK